MLKMLKPDSKGIFPIVNENLNDKIILDVDEYDNGCNCNYFRVDNKTGNIYVLPTMEVINSHLTYQNKSIDYQSLFRILGSKYKPHNTTTYFIIFDNSMEYGLWYDQKYGRNATALLKTSSRFIISDPTS